MPFALRCPAAKPTTTEYCNLSSTLGELDGASELAFVLRGQLSGQCSEAVEVGRVAMCAAGRVPASGRAGVQVSAPEFSGCCVHRRNSGGSRPDLSEPRRMPIISIKTAKGKARGLLETAKRQLGFVPNMYGAMANEPALLESYTATYALFRAECAFTPAEQEVIFLVISRNNACDYCMGRPQRRGRQDVEGTARSHGRYSGRPANRGSEDSGLATFTKIMFDTRGRPSEADFKNSLPKNTPSASSSLSASRRSATTPATSSIPQ